MEKRLTDYEACLNIKDDPVLRGTKTQVFYVKGKSKYQVKDRRFQYFYNKLFVFKMDRLLEIFFSFGLGLQF